MLKILTSVPAPLSPVPLYFSALSLLSTALLYLNAWNRLGSVSKRGKCVSTQVQSQKTSRINCTGHSIMHRTPNKNKGLRSRKCPKYMSDLFITLWLQSKFLHYVLICCTQKLEQNASKEKKWVFIFLHLHGTLNDEKELSLCKT